MKHIDLAAQGAAVQRFFQKLQVAGQGSVVEMNGHAVAHVLPVADADEENVTSADWTEAQNERRCQLIDREIAGTLTPDEALELARLQKRMLAYQDRVAPLPLEATRRLHEQLLRKAKPGPTRRRP